MYFILIHILSKNKNRIIRANFVLPCRSKWKLLGILNSSIEIIGIVELWQRQWKKGMRKVLNLGILVTDLEMK